jgi:hypothetical protein
MIMKVEPEDLVEIVRHQNDVIEALAEHVSHDPDCPGDLGCTCGLLDVLAVVFHHDPTTPDAIEH